MWRHTSVTSAFGRWRLENLKVKAWNSYRRPYLKNFLSCIKYSLGFYLVGDHLWGRDKETDILWWHTIISLCFMFLSFKVVSENFSCLFRIQSCLWYGACCAGLAVWAEHMEVEGESQFHKVFLPTCILWYHACKLIVKIQVQGIVVMSCLCFSCIFLSFS